MERQIFLVLIPGEFLWTLIPLGFLLRWVVRIAVPHMSGTRRNFWDTVVVLGGNTLMLLGLAGLGWVAFFCGLTLAAMAYHRFRVTESQGLVGYLAHAMGQSVSMSEAAMAYAHEQHGDMQRRGLLLVSLLQHGWPLGGALDRVGMTLPTHVKMAVAIHDRDPRMRDVIARAAEQRQLLAAVWSVYVERFVFLLVFLIAFAVIQLLLFTKVLPTYSTIFSDFSSQLPIVTQWFIDISPFQLVPESVVGLMLPLALFVFAFLTLVVPIVFVLYYTGWVTWRPQMVQRWLFPLDMSFVYRIFAIGERQGIPLIETLREVSLEHPVPLMRKRVDAAGLRIEAGEEWISVFQKQHLLRPVDAAILRAAQKAGNSNWVWDDLATAAHRRWSYRAAAVAQIVFPVVILFFGVMVAVSVYAYFAPLVKLIEGLS